MLMDFTLHNPLDDADTHTTILACATEETTQLTKRSSSSSSLSCPTGNKKTQVTLERQSWGSKSPDQSSNVIKVAQHIKSYIEDDASCETSISWGYFDGAVVGVYYGVQLQSSDVANVLQQFIDSVSEDGITSRTAAQYCGSTASAAFGIVADTQGSLPDLQQIMMTWNAGGCISDGEDTTSWGNVEISTTVASNSTSSTKSAASSALSSHVTVSNRGHSYTHRHLHRRADCSVVQVSSGELCGDLATKCGISLADFDTYNPGSNFCTTLAVGQYVCCSSGSLPDMSPQRNSDGSCHSYTVQPEDSCSALATANSLTIATIEEYNKDTWAWMGCGDLQVYALICLSSGNPPMPASVANAMCGPQVPGTIAPTNGTALSDLNQCPLNSCCDIWGQCGITSVYCTASNSSTGAPGTAAPKSNGCISNCGTDIVNNSDPPENFMSVAYFEGFNTQRNCLTMSVADLDTTKYTHIHYAFADITSDYLVNITAIRDDMEAFQELTGIKKIISFGGWSFSTSRDSYPIFREGVTDANRKTFAEDVAAVIEDYGLDGVDFDWEYPGAPDIPGIPAGSPSDGPNYLAFLKEMRSALSSDRTLSIAAPASYWYLKGFPIAEMSDVLDYIIYMTYDLYGQWDWNSTWSDDGCPAGNCLRSHVNLTETTSALSMITKAGVPANKVVVGVTSYGRSFEMTKAGCTGPDCTFVGPDSGATPGECTNTAGYIANAEIDDIIANDNTSQIIFDAASDSDIMVYNDTQWVAYMTNTTKSTRIAYYQGLNFAGTSDWAVGLQSFIDDYPVPDLPDCDSVYTSLDAIFADDDIPAWCQNAYVADVLNQNLTTSLENYTDILANGYDQKFTVYSQYIQQLIPEQIANFMSANASNWCICAVETYVYCCGDCSTRDCQENCVKYDGCVSGYQNVTSTCPVGIPETTTHQGQPDSEHYNCADSDGMLRDIETIYGISPDWISLGNLPIYDPCQGTYSECWDQNTWYTGYPVLNDNFTVPNPKNTIAAALSNLTTLTTMLDGAIADSLGFVWGGNTSDMIDASVLPIYMAASAVQSMIQIEEEAAQITAEERKERILDFIFGFLMILPAAGELVDAVDMATLSRIISVLGDVGNGALAVYGIVENPKTVIGDIFGALMGRAVSDEDNFEGAAIARRAVSDEDLSSLGLAGEVTDVDLVNVKCI